MGIRGLQYKFGLIIALTYLAIGAATLVASRFAIDRVLHYLGTTFAVKQALLEKTKILSEIQRDLSLSLKLAHSPLLRRWAAQENDPALKSLALAELESYRTLFRDKSWFFIIDASRHYYFNDAGAHYTGKELRFSLDEADRNDAWYFRTMREVDSYALNMDFDNALNVTKVWFNVVIRDDAGRKIGIGGSGIDISKFLDRIVHSDERGVSTVLISRDGTIEAHQEKRYMEHNSRVRGGEKKITIYDLMESAREKALLRSAVERLTTGENEAEPFEITLAGKRCLAALAYLKDIGWYNLVLVDSAEVISLKDFVPMIAITILSLLAGIAIIGFLLNRIVLSPLAVLSRSAEEIGKGNYGITAPVRTEDEIGQLTACFNHMATTVRDYTENLEHKVKERTGELHVLNGKLSESNRQIMDSLRYARMIQHSLLPRSDAMARHLREFFVLYKPRDIVGGDFYYFREADGLFLLAVIDCTGHGVPGALMTMTVNAVLNHVLSGMGPEDPAAVLRELNGALRATLRHDAADTHIDSGLDIGICCLDPRERRVTFAAARMSLFYSDGGEVSELRGDKKPLGYRASDAPCSYTNHILAPGPEMAFYLTTDGLLDQSGGEKGFGFGKRRFGDLVRAGAGRPLDEQKELFEAALLEYQGDTPQRDDITLVAFRM